MGQLEGGETQQHSVDASERLLEVRNHMAYMAGGELVDGRRVPRAPDKYMSAAIGSFAMYLGSGEYPALDDLFLEDIERFPGRTPNNRTNLAPRLDQDFRRRHGLPLGLTVPGEHVDYFEALQHSPEERGHFRRNSARNVRTNVADRGVPLELVTLLLDSPEPQNILDLGCNDNQIALKLAYQGEEEHGKYRHVDIFEPSGAGGRLQHNEIDSISINRMLRDEQPRIANIVGVDMQDLPDPANPAAHEAREWNLSCLYTRELLHDPSRVHEYLLWEGTKLPNVHFHKDDITRLNAARLRTAFPNIENYDIANLSTVAYQFGEEGLRQTVESLRQVMKPDGKIVMTDFVEKVGRRMRFLEKWLPFTYRTFMLDLAREDLGWQPLFAWESGRIGKGILLPRLGQFEEANVRGLRSRRAAAMALNAAMHENAA